MPPNTADKRKAVLVLLNDAEWSAWSDRAIAKQCHVSDKTVAAHRASHCGNSAVTGEDSAKRTYTTKHGTEATMDTASQKKAAAEKKAKGKPAETTTATPTPAPGPASGMRTGSTEPAPDAMVLVLTSASLAISAFVDANVAPGATLAGWPPGRHALQATTAAASGGRPAGHLIVNPVHL